MKLEFGPKLQPYEKLTDLTVVVSDWHYGHYEFDRVGKNGISPHTITHRICRAGINHNIFLVHLGDLIDSVARAPEAIKMFVTQLAEGKTIRSFPDLNIHGNHDARWKGTLELEIPDSDIWLPEDSMVMGAHGHQAHRWWMKGKGARKWLHEQTYRLGFTIQDVIHPDADSWILDAGKTVGELFIQPGRKLGRNKVLTWAVETACKYFRALILHGHTHSVGVYVMQRIRGSERPIKGSDLVSTQWVSVDKRYRVTAKVPPHSHLASVTVVDVGTALPHGDNHPEGLYEKGDVFPFGYVVERQELVRFEMEGFRSISVQLPPDSISQ